MVTRQSRDPGARLEALEGQPAPLQGERHVTDRLRVKRLIREEWSDRPHAMMVSEKSTLRKENAYTFSPPIGFKSARVAYGTEEAFSHVGRSLA